MENQIFTFLPNTQEELWWFWGGASLALVAGSAAFILIKKSWKQKATAARTLPAMLLFFVALSGIGSAIFSGVQLLRLQPLKMDATGLYLKKDTVRWTEIAEIRIQSAETRNALNMPATDTRILIIRTDKGRYFFFSGENYALPEILGQMKELHKME
jgi:cytochrome bd-type quinol oxidase subunit 1